MVEQAFPLKSAGPALDSKVAVITGAAKGIGLGCARVLGAAGAAIAALDLDQAALQPALHDLQSHGITAEGYTANVGNSADVTSAIDQLVGRFGRIDILVNNAGTHDGKGTEEAGEADWDRILGNNLKSVFLVTRACLPYLKVSRGSIVHMGSMVGLVGQAKSAAYSASKGGIAALTKNMALDFAPYRIRVNCVCPGWVATPLVDDWFRLQPDESAARAYVDSIHPLGRIASADEIGKVVLFLASDQASFVTGVAIPVDGGVTLGY
jgi:NAD(P)-dependent dehydrogenase (short-subunit alcohol dehydrogenase family)